jgi:hypothetical protein
MRQKIYIDPTNENCSVNECFKYLTDEYIENGECYVHTILSLRDALKEAIVENEELKQERNRFKSALGRFKKYWHNTLWNMTCSKPAYDAYKALTTNK